MTSPTITSNLSIVGNVLGAGLSLLAEYGKPLPKKPISWIEDPVGRIEQIRYAEDRTVLGKKWSQISNYAGVTGAVATTFLTANVLWQPAMFLQTMVQNPALVPVQLILPFICGGIVGAGTLVGFEFGGDMVRKTSNYITNFF